MFIVWQQRTQRKFQAALTDSQINDTKVPATSAMCPISDWRKFEAARITDRWKGYCEDLYQYEEGKSIDRAGSSVRLKPGTTKIYKAGLGPLLARKFLERKFLWYCKNFQS